MAARPSPADSRWMRRALALARRGGPAVHPNPRVGCVLVRDGRAVGEGWHRAAGGPHAEAWALRAAGPLARGATAYVTLEPCLPAPGKRTPSCAEALAEAGVARVVAAVLDPSPTLSGRGLASLRRAGVRAARGVLEREAEALNAAFLSRIRRRRPRVVLKLALSLDGRAAADGGRSRWITGPEARREAHALRAACDAVLVGVGTVLADDPALTAHGRGRDPVRVVLDTRLRTPARARVADGRPPTWVFTASRGRAPGRAEAVRVPRRGRGLDLEAVLWELARRGVDRLLVEGGPRVWSSFLAADLADEARVFLSPKLLSGTRDPNRAPAVAAPRLRQCGADFLFYGAVRCSRG